MKKEKLWEETSNVRSAGYTEEVKALRLTFKTGKSYLYSGVPSDVWEKCLEAESGTAFLNAYIRGKYEYQEIV